MATIKPLSVSAKRLAQTITGSSSSFKLDNILTWDGVTNLASSDFGSKAYAAFRNSAGTLVEFMEIDPSTIASGSITILRRGLKYNGDDLTTEVSANKLTWVKGDTIVELGTHMPQLFAHYVDILSAQSIAGVKTFSEFPVKSGSTTPTSTAQFATKAYVDGVAGGSANYDQNLVTGTAGEDLVAGDWVYFKTSDQKWWKTSSAAASTSKYVKLGVAQATIATDASGVILIGGLDKTQTGLTAGSAYFLTTAGDISTTPGTYRRFVGWANSTTELFLDCDNDMDSVKIDGQQVYAADSVGTDAYVIAPAVAITAYSDGMRFFFKAGAANTGNATLAVSGLTAKNILKTYDATLADGDIVAGQIVEVVYDATQGAFQMVSPVANTPLTSTALKFGGDGSDGALSVSSGTTTIDLGSAAIVYKNYTSISITGTGNIAFSNPASGGTLVILRSQGDVTITSSAARAIDLRGVGAAVATAPTGFIYDTTSTHAGANGATGNAGGAGGSAGTRFDTVTYTWFYTNTVDKMHRQGMSKFFIPGAGGGNGGNNYGSSASGGAGGRGGGALYIECGGAFNFDAASTIDISGQDGAAGGNGSAGADASGAGGGAGGNVGHMIILYNSLTANAGTVTASGGAGGAGGTSPGGANARAGGGGGSSGGGTQAAGAAGGNTGNPGSSGGNGGAGIGGGGGGGNGSADSPGGNGGSGGTGGADSTAYLITKNLWFA